MHSLIFSTLIVALGSFVCLTPGAARANSCQEPSIGVRPALDAEDVPANTKIWIDAAKFGTDAAERRAQLELSGPDGPVPISTTAIEKRFVLDGEYEYAEVWVVQPAALLPAGPYTLSTGDEVQTRFTVGEAADDAPPPPPEVDAVLLYVSDAGDDLDVRTAIIDLTEAYDILVLEEEAPARSTSPACPGHSSTRPSEAHTSSARAPATTTGSPRPAAAPASASPASTSPATFPAGPGGSTSSYPSALAVAARPTPTPAPRGPCSPPSACSGSDAAETGPPFKL